MVIGVAILVFKSDNVCLYLVCLDHENTNKKKKAKGKNKTGITFNIK